jgi:hypothetical protein
MLERMFQSVPAYVGNGHYCYANATAMLLAAAGEQVAPGLIEVASGVSLGAGWNDAMDLIFFDSVAPDAGISRALGVLGFEADERASMDGEPAPLAALSEALVSGPAVLGPLDMGLLLYQPGKGRPSGVDHFVLAYAADEAEVYLHDPAGYPGVLLTWADLAAAWAAERVGYRRGAYRWWHHPRRVSSPTDDALVERVLASCAEVYRLADARAVRGVTIGGAAIRRLAARFEAGDLPSHLLGHLRGFTFQVAARRALDFARFFGERAPDLASLKTEQGRLFGRAHTLLVRQDWSGTADALTALAAVEDQVRSLLIGSPVPA